MIIKYQKSKIINILWAFFLLFACNGSESDPPQIIDTFILSAEVKNKETNDIKVDNLARIIDIEFAKDETRNDVIVSLVLAEGISMLSPATTEAEYNLENPATIRLSSGNREVNFIMSAKNGAPDPCETDPQPDCPNYIDPCETNPQPGCPNYEDPYTTKGWTVTTSFGELPDGIIVYKSPAQLQGKNAVAYLTTASVKKGITFHVLGEASGYNTPTQFYDKTGKIYPVIINAGYFWDGVNLSLLCRDGQIVCPNNQVVTRSNGTSDAPFYPTRGVFSLINAEDYRTDWVFTTVTPGTTFAYPEPAPNKTGSPPLQTPSATFPTGAWEFKAKTAIGGGPVLIKDGEYRNTWEEELYDAASGIGPTANNPRTAIGITADKNLMLFVCEGRNMTPNTPGFTLAEVAQIMADLGCVELLNLDGGGSSCMLVNGKETIKPSDGQQRAIVSAVAFK